MNVCMNVRRVVYRVMTLANTKLHKHELKACMPTESAKKEEEVWRQHCEGDLFYNHTLRVASKVLFIQTLRLIF